MNQALDYRFRTQKGDLAKDIDIEYNRLEHNRNPYFIDVEMEEAYAYVKNEADCTSWFLK